MDIPKTKKENVVEVIHGKEITDSYRWLEDVNNQDTQMARTPKFAHQSCIINSVS